MSKWPTVPLDQVVALQRGFDLPAPERRPGPYPVLGSSGISGWHDKGLVPGPGVTIGRSGASIGVATYFDGPCWPLNTTLFVKDYRGNDPRYIYYLLRSIDFRSFNSGSAQPSLNRNYIANIQVKLPSSVQQREIAATLGALDDKIAVNDRIASAALDLAVARYSQLAEIEGWETRQLRDTSQWLSGGTPKTSEPTYWGGDIPWISALSLRSPWIFESTRNITALGAQNGTRLVPSETILFVVRGSSLDTEFRVGITQREVAFGQDCKALRTCDEVDATTLFVALRANSKKILKLVDHAGHGAGRLSTDLIGSFEVKLPSGQRVVSVADQLKPLVDLGAAKQVENRELVTLRDTLLPKLMSGEIRVRDAEKAVEDAV